MMRSSWLKIKHNDNCILLFCFFTVLAWSSPLWLKPGFEAHTGAINIINVVLVLVRRM